MLHQFADNLLHNLFKPLLLFFYAGFLIPLFRVNFEFPKAMYQGLTMYLLLAIGWHGGEELANLPAAALGQAGGFMLVGFLTNAIVGIVAYQVLKRFTKLRRIDAATVAGYYGSDSAGTFVTCLGVLAAAKIAYAPYMPVMLAVMEIPGCLVALSLVSNMRRKGMDEAGYMPDEVGYGQHSRSSVSRVIVSDHTEVEEEEELAAVGANGGSSVHRRRTVRAGGYSNPVEINVSGDLPKSEHDKAVDFEAEISMEDPNSADDAAHGAHGKGLGAILHEVFLNPGIYLLFASILIGFVSGMQGETVTKPDDELFVRLFPALLCLFLLEMGMTASKRLKDLRQAGWRFIAFGLLAPNVFATMGMLVAHGYSLAIGQPFDIGTYTLFAVLCGAASYIAVPAVQRLAIPEASPTLPLAASLGLTFSYNVTIGIPVYIMIANIIKGST
jgi:hypothetical protein